MPQYDANVTTHRTTKLQSIYNSDKTAYWTAYWTAQWTTFISPNITTFISAIRGSFFSTNFQAK